MEEKIIPDELFLHAVYTKEENGTIIGRRDIRTERTSDDDIRYVKDDNSFIELWKQLPHTITVDEKRYHLGIEKEDCSVFYKLETDDSLCNDLYLETFFGKDDDIIMPMQRMVEFLKEYKLI